MQMLIFMLVLSLYQIEGIDHQMKISQYIRTTFYLLSNKPFQNFMHRSQKGPGLTLFGPVVMLKDSAYDPVF